MNKIALLFFILFLFSCEKVQQIEKEYNTTATIYLINESSVVVRSNSRLNYALNPRDTIIHIENSLLSGGRPSVENYFLPFAEYADTFRYDIENENRCEDRLTGLKFYENKQEVDDLKFEFTFRFTEERMKSAFPCK